MTKRRPKYSGVLATPMQLHSTRELGIYAGMSSAEVRRRNDAIKRARVQALREHYGLTKSEPNWVLIIRMGCDLGIPGCQEATSRRKRKDAVDPVSRRELVAELLEIMNGGSNVNEACIILAKRLTKESGGKTKLNPKSLRARYYDAIQEWGDEEIEKLKTYFH